MQGKLFQKCTHLLYCSALSLGGNVNTRRMLQPDMGSIFHIKKSTKYSGHRKLLYKLSKLSNLILLTSSDHKRTLMHLFLFTNSAQRELVSICTQSIYDRNKLSLPYILDCMHTRQHFLSARIIGYIYLLCKNMKMLLICIKYVKQNSNIYFKTHL